MWSRLPLGSRPKLLVFGESLGSFGAESAFGGADDIRNRVDGMLLVGPPNTNELWREYVADRDAGTTEILPTYENGATIRFAARPGHRPGPAIDDVEHAAGGVPAAPVGSDRVVGAQADGQPP